jgi:hypothetical protein
MCAHGSCLMCSLIAYGSQRSGVRSDRPTAGFVTRGLTSVCDHHTLCDSVGVIVSVVCRCALFLFMSSIQTRRVVAERSIVEASASSAADALIAARVVAGTRKRYAACLTVMRDWFAEFRSDTPFTPPLPISSLQLFFGWLTDFKYKAKPAAFSTFCGYKSALMWYYAESSVVMSAEDKSRLDQVVKGYSKQVPVSSWRARCPWLRARTA